MKFSRIEQETIINFNAEEKSAVIYTRDPAIIRHLDSLANAFPEIYHCVVETDIDKTYEVPKQYINYRKPRNISDKQREEARERMQRINGKGGSHE